MDYGKLSKDQLIDLCKENGISYSSTYTKDKLIDLLINTKPKQQKLQTQQTSTKSFNAEPPEPYEVDTLAKTGAILALIITPLISFFVILSIWILIVWVNVISIELETNDFKIIVAFLWLIIIALTFRVVVVIVISIMVLLGKINKIVAGVPLLFLAFISGILIIASKYESKKSYNQHWGIE